MGLFCSEFLITLGEAGSGSFLTEAEILKALTYY